MLVDKLPPTVEMGVARIDVKMEEKVLLAGCATGMLKEGGVEYLPCPRIGWMV